MLCAIIDKSAQQFKGIRHGCRSMFIHVPFEPLNINLREHGHPFFAKLLFKVKLVPVKIGLTAFEFLPPWTVKISFLDLIQGSIMQDLILPDFLLSLDRFSMSGKLDPFAPQTCRDLW